MTTIFRICHLLLVGLCALTLAPAAQAKTDLILWHSMPGALGTWIDDLAKGFNAGNAGYRVVPVYKGSYDSSLTEALQAHSRGKAPHMVQVFEVGTATMMAARDLIRPVHEVMALAGLDFVENAYLPAVTLYYSSLDGKLLSLPLNSSTPVLVANRKALARSGLNPKQIPTTWPELEATGRALINAGFSCGFTSQWQSWILLENMSAWHDVPFASKQNGIGGIDVELKFNSPFHVTHVERLAAMVKDKVFLPPSHRDEALSKFLDGTCPLLLATSASYGELKAHEDLDFGIGMLPYWPEIQWAPRNSIIGGATLWAMNGHPATDYVGIAQFFHYLTSAEVQAASHQRTGYLPISRAAYSLSRRQGFYESNPEAETAIKQITLHWPTENSRGVRLGSFIPIRAVIDQHLDAIWEGRETAKQGLDEAVRRGNELLKDFSREANSGR
ncbi:MAG: sn-glycerol-3-phosphate ABC transporter substrate-binding protein UgpB [Magnetospirillum gryphiswaldense]|nr:sn-glycerol-3-phosphate ABC transporter substrate-binding protein UgpB [Magnetospirillum gryphiswaldense]